MIKSIEKAEKLVSKILLDYPQARDDDRVLIMMVWQAQGWRPTDETLMWISRKGLTPESITRCRRKIQETGRLVGTKRQKRMEEEGKVREWSRGQGQLL